MINDLTSENNLILIGLAIYALIFLIFFPPYFASIDEHSLLKNAILLKSGNFELAEPNAELACRANTYTDAGYVASQFAGKSFFLIPFTFLGFEGAMLSGLIIHLANALLIFLILKKLSIDARFTLLYLFFPAMLWGSRTLYSELLVLTFFLAGFYFYIKNNFKSDILSGALFGLAAFIRYDAIVGIVAFCVPLILNGRKKLLQILIGFIPIAALIALFNSTVYGGALQTGYGSGTSLISSIISANFNIETLLLSILLLLLVYPLMITSIFQNKWKGYFYQFAFLCIAYLLLNTRFTNFLAFDFSAQTLFTARFRYLIPLVGLLLIPYAAFLQNLFKSASEKFKISHNSLFVILLILFSLCAVYASNVHNEFLSSRAQTHLQINSSIPQNALIIGSSDDCIYSLSKDLSRRRYLNILPKIETGSNGSQINIGDYLNETTYFVELKYTHLENSNSLRQDVINAERKAMSDFISKNKENLELIFETEKPNPLKIYRWRE